MAKVWLMKVFKEWFDEFIDEPGFVGIDEEGIDDWYTKFNERQIERMFSGFARPGMRRNFFERFVNEMSIGDIVILGIGQTTQFSVGAIAKITGDYKFDPNREIRHYRKADIKVIDNPFPYNKWGWARRIEELPESRMEEFTEVIANIVF